MSRHGHAERYEEPTGWAWWWELTLALVELVVILLREAALGSWLVARWMLAPLAGGAIAWLLMRWLLGQL
jgi:hypothetical protein